MPLLVIADIEDLRWKHGVGEADILLSCGDVSDHVIMEAACGETQVIGVHRLATNSIF